MSLSSERSSTAWNSAALVPNMRTTYGWLMPAAFATASVVAPTYPRSPKTRGGRGEDQLAAILGLMRVAGASVTVTLDMLSVDNLSS